MRLRLLLASSCVACRARLMRATPRDERRLVHRRLSRRRQERAARQPAVRYQRPRRPASPIGGAVGTLSVFNRPIVTFRATMLGVAPQDRADSAHSADRLRSSSAAATAT